MSKKVNEKWKKTFPDAIGNQNRPVNGVDDTQPFETGAFPQYIANDPVRYDLQNAAMSQSMSNDARLKEMVDARGKELDDHKVDPGAHKTGIAGNAATATKLQTPRTLSLTGKAAGSATFDGSANAAINVTSVNADTASKLSTARKINITGNATGSTTFDGTSDVNINTTVNESKHATAADTLKSSPATETSTIARPVWLSDENDNTKQVVSPNLTYTCSTKTLTAANFAGHLAGNADSATMATKLATARTISLTGNATGAAAFDGSGNISISTTVNDSKHAAAADMATNDSNGDKIDDTYLKKTTVIDVIYPIGSIYMSMSATNPADLFGVGTWKRISQGRMLLGADDSTYKAGATGGEATHTLTANEMPAHSHGISTSGDHNHKFYGSDNNNGNTSEGAGMGMDTGGNGYMSRNMIYHTANAGAHTHTISNSGGGAAHNNMPPYLVCYIWQRTA